MLSILQLFSAKPVTYLHASLHGGEVSEWHFPGCHLPQGHCKAPHVCCLHIQVLGFLLEGCAQGKETNGYRYNGMLYYWFVYLTEIHIMHIARSSSWKFTFRREPLRGVYFPSLLEWELGICHADACCEVIINLRVKSLEAYWRFVYSHKS